jgi:hypothetical protein
MNHYKVTLECIVHAADAQQAVEYAQEYAKLWREHEFKHLADLQVRKDLWAAGTEEACDTCAVCVD